MMSKKPSATDFSSQHPREMLKRKLSEYANVIVEKHLTCPICLDVITDAHTNPECLHRYCGKCIKQSLNQCNHECPGSTCRVHIPTHQTLKKDTAFEGIKDAFLQIIQIIDSTLDRLPNTISYDSPPISRQKSFCLHRTDFTTPCDDDKSNNEFCLGSATSSTCSTKENITQCTDNTKTMASSQQHCEKVSSSHHEPSHTVESLLSTSYHESIRKESLKQTFQHENYDTEIYEGRDDMPVLDMHYQQEQDRLSKQPSKRITESSKERATDATSRIDNSSSLSRISPSIKRGRDDNFDSSPSTDARGAKRCKSDGAQQASSKAMPPNSATKKGTKKNLKYFNDWYKELVEFKKKYGHCNVSRSKHTPQYNALGTWCNQIRQMKKGNKKDRKLKPSEIRSLERIGFQWKFRKSFHHWYKELVSFKKKFGHCNVTRIKKEHRPLADWCNRMRQIRRVNTTDRMPITPSEINALDSIGFRWIRVKSNGEPL